LRESLEEARQLAVKAVQINPVLSEAAVLAAYVTFLKGDAPGAYQELSNVLATYPDDPIGWDKMAEICAAMGNKQRVQSARALAQRLRAKKQARDTLGPPTSAPISPEETAP
jgi:predicted Zn-dependent protease